MLKKIMGKWNAIIRGLRILNREYFSTRNDCLGKCGINSHYLPPTLLGKRENIFLYDNANRAIDSKFITSCGTQLPGHTRFHNRKLLHCSHPYMHGRPEEGYRHCLRHRIFPSHFQ